MSRYIDADALRKEFEREGELNPCDRLFWGKVLSVIDNAPTIESLDLDVYIGGRHCGKRQRLLDELRPKGKWIEKEDYVGDTYYDCSNCGNSWSTLEGNPWQNGMSFCPNCGANMVVDLCSICKHGDNCERSDKGISFANHSSCWKFER